MIQSTQPIKALLKIWETERLITPLDRHFALELARLHQTQLTELDAPCSVNSYLSNIPACPFTR